MKKLSKTQQEVVDLMRSGWELGNSGGFYSRTWLQKGGCGRGGDTKTVSVATLFALRKVNAIKVKNSQWALTTYQLTGDFK